VIWVAQPDVRLGWTMPLGGRAAALFPETEPQSTCQGGAIRNCMLYSTEKLASCISCGGKGYTRPQPASEPDLLDTRWMIAQASTP
jgi:hypothetical protein